MEASGSPVGDLLSSFSTSFTRQKDYQRQKAELAAADADRRAGQYGSATGGNSGAVGPEAGYNDRGSAASVADPASANMPGYQRAFLNAVADGESPGGAYDVRYTPQGGTRFDMSSGHPRIFEPTSEGKKSSAAGRYQFTWTTWKGLAGADTPFTPENQDQYAWKLATQDYAARTGGGDLGEYLQTYGMTPELQSILAPTWASMKGNHAGRAATYAESLARYQAPAAPVSRSINNSPLGISLGAAQ